MKKLKLVLMTAVMVPGLAFAANDTNKGANPNGKPFIELAGQIVEVEGEISSLQDQIDALVGRVDSIEAEQAAVQSAISDLQAVNVTLQAQIDANAGDVDSLEGEISVINSTILNLQQDIEDLGDADGALQAQIDANEASVTTLALAIDTLEGDLQAFIDNNAALIANMQTLLTALAIDIAEKQNRVNGLCADGSAIQEILADGSVICGLATGGGAGTLLSTRVQMSTNFNGSGYTSARATCPSGYVITGGGFHTHGDIRDSRAVSNSQWYVFGYSSSHIIAYANCGKIQP